MKISHNSLSLNPLSFTANIIVLLVIPTVNNLSALRNAAAVPRSSARPTVRRVANIIRRHEKRKDTVGGKPSCAWRDDHRAFRDKSAIARARARAREKDETRKMDGQMDYGVGGKREERHEIWRSTSRSDRNGSGTKLSLTSFAIDACTPPLFFPPLAWYRASQ